MAVIRELGKTDAIYVESIAKLHIKGFPSFFLTQLGAQFLKTLYTGYLEDKDSGLIVAEENGNLIGFIAYSKDYSKLYKGLIKNHLFKFAFCSIGAAIRHPSFIKRLFGAFRKSESVVKTEPYVELASICVDPEKESTPIFYRTNFAIRGIIVQIQKNSASRAIKIHIIHQLFFFLSCRYIFHTIFCY